MDCVVQKHNFGCGVACVAFVADVSYETALKLLGEDKAATRGFYCKELLNILQKLGKGYRYKYIKPRLRRGIYQERSIVFIQRSARYPAGHYLVRFGSCWMDPWINFSSDKDIKNAKSGLRIRLPGRPIYALIPKI